MIQKTNRIYLVDDQGGYALATGKRAPEYAQAMLVLCRGWRVVTKAEYMKAKRAASAQERTADHD